jgi:uncharacterized protein
MLITHDVFDEVVRHRPFLHSLDPNRSFVDGSSRAAIAAVWLSSWYSNYTFIIPFHCGKKNCMGFEYDSEKSVENKRKHGVDFEEAQALWSDSALLEIPARVTDEPRWVVIGKMNAKHWSAVVTRRGDNVRIISVRRSRDEEVTIYESQDI